MTISPFYFGHLSFNSVYTWNAFFSELCQIITGGHLVPCALGGVVTVRKELNEAAGGYNIGSSS